MKQISMTLFFSGSVIAIPAVNDTVLFIKVVSKEFSGDSHVNDDSGNIIFPQTAYFTGNFSECVCYNKSSI